MSFQQPIPKVFPILTNNRDSVHFSPIWQFDRHNNTEKCSSLSHKLLVPINDQVRRETEKEGE